MNRRNWIIASLCPLAGGSAWALEDPGKAKIGLVCVTLYHATDGGRGSARKGSCSVRVAVQVFDGFQEEAGEAAAGPSLAELLAGGSAEAGEAVFMHEIDGGEDEEAG